MIPMDGQGGGSLIWLKEIVQSKISPHYLHFHHQTNSLHLVKDKMGQIAYDIDQLMDSKANIHQFHELIHKPRAPVWGKEGKVIWLSN